MFVHLLVDYASVPLGVIWSCFYTMCRIPDTSGIKQKMLYASSKDALKKKLGITLEVQATDKDDVEYKEVYEKLSRGGTN